MKDEYLTYRIISAAIEVHMHLGPGLLENVYQHCLFYELSLQGLQVKEQVKTAVNYKGIDIASGFRMDLLVNDRVVVEIKSVENLHPVHIAQVVTYLRASKLQTGLLINFNVMTLKNGVRRVIND
jgi:GxxExxY protein